MSQAGKTILKRLRVSTKVIIGGLIITSLFVLTNFLVIIPTAEKALINKKREKLREATETAWSILNHHNSLAEQGIMPLQEARRQAANLIKHIRYGPEMKDYFWINDMQPRMIMHPYKPEMDGSDLVKFRDPNGTALFVEAVNVCRQDGAGFVQYSWQWQDDATRIVPKISYVRLFRPWGWIIGTGMYIEDVRAEIRTWKIRLSQVSAAIALVGIIMSWLIGHAVARQIQLLSAAHGDDIMAAHSTAVKLQTFVLLLVVPALLVVTLFWGFIFYNQLHNIIIDGFNRKLAGLSGSTGCFIKGEEHAAIYKSHDMQSPVYRKYVRTMKRILDRTGLTYLYTQVLQEKPNCVYVLDATQESMIGDEDTLASEDYDGAQRVLLYGVIHIGDITATDQWGLLKVSYAPIYNIDDSITAMTGADINITVVNNKTRLALFTLGMLALGAALGAGYISIQFSAKLIKPITALRNSALMIAAGVYSHKVEITTPSELQRLSSAFNGLGRKLEETVHNLRTTNSDIGARRMNNDLLSALDRSTQQCSQESCENWAFGWTDSSDHRTSSGYASNGDRTVAWLAKDHHENAIDAIGKRCETCAMISGGLDHPADPALKTTVTYSEKGIFCRTDTPVPALTIKAGKIEETQLNNGHTPLNTDIEWIIISDNLETISDEVKNMLLMKQNQADPPKAFELISVILKELTNRDGRQIFIGVFRNRKAAP